MEFNFTAIANSIILISGLIIAVKKIKEEIFKSATMEIRTINSKLDDMNKDIKYIQKVVFQLLQHEVTGDHVNDMQELYDEMKERLFEE